MAARTDDSSGRPAKVLIVEDHPLFRERLALLIKEEPGMEICGATDNITQAMELILETDPDIAIVDLTLKGSGGLELIKDIKERGLALHVLVLSMHDEELFAERVLRAGARGYITKNEASSTVVAAIRAVLAGEVYLSKPAMSRILDRVSGRDEQGVTDRVELLADRELEVFHLIGLGRSLKEIAQMLHLGETTIDTYRARIREKLGLRNAAELYLRAGQWVRERGLG